MYSYFLVEYESKAEYGGDCFTFADALTACEMLLKVDRILDGWRKFKS